MDRGTKIYSAVLLLLVVVLVVAFTHQSSTVRELNVELEQDAVLAAYPYSFRVLRIDGHTAVMTTPRSAEVPVAVMITAIAPELKGVSPDAVAFQHAQKQLAEHQALARNIVVRHPEIQGVQWELDREWIIGHGIQALP